MQKAQKGRNFALAHLPTVIAELHANESNFREVIG